MGSSSVDTFEQMYHQELSQVMAQKGVFGLGDWLSEQVQKQTNTTKAMDAYQQLYGQTSSPAMALDPVAEKRSFSMQDKPVTGIEL
jgi:Rod binding domain-containing protein